MMIENERVRQIEERYKLGELGVKDAGESKVVGKRQDERSLKKEKMSKESKRIEAKAERARSPPR